MKRMSIEGIELGSGAPALIVANVSRHPRADSLAPAEAIRSAGLAGADAVRVRAAVPDPRRSGESHPVGDLGRVAAESHVSLVVTCATPVDVAASATLRAPALALEPGALADDATLAAAAESRLPVFVLCGRASPAIVARALRVLGRFAIPMPSDARVLDEGHAWGHVAHDPSPADAQAALVHGAAVIERGLSVDRHACDRARRRCAEPRVFHELVLGIRAAEAARAGARAEVIRYPR